MHVKSSDPGENQAVDPLFQVAPSISPKKGNQRKDSLTAYLTNQNILERFVQVKSIDPGENQALDPRFQVAPSITPNKVIPRKDSRTA